MSKRHTKQNAKQSLGQYFTTNADFILSGFESIVASKNIVDPFAGGWDLLNWAERNNANSVLGYDIEPKTPNTIYRDSLLLPDDYSGKLVLTNPPYLSANKSKGKYKNVYEKWKQNDLYKCFLTSLGRMNAPEAIVIIPSNFLCEKSSTARAALFSEYDVKFAKYWKESVFDDATTGVCALYLKRNIGLNKGIQIFDCNILPEKKIITMKLERDCGYIHGGREIANLNRTFIFEKVSDKSEDVNTNIVVGCLDAGKYKLGFHYNNGAPIKVPKTVITTFQVNSIGFELTKKQQTEIVDTANRNLYRLRSAYDSMFLSNYMGAIQKIMSVNIAKAFLSDATKTVLESCDYAREERSLIEKGIL